jgi:hypothetical protein
MTIDVAQHNQGYPVNGADWTEEHWHGLLEQLISQGIVSWREVTSTMLGSINPSQVGTSIASKKTFQSHFEPRKCWAAVRAWHFMQNGRCADCDTRVDLQADHAVPREFVAGVGLWAGQNFPYILQRDPATVVGSIKTQLSGMLVQHNYQGIAETLLESLSWDLHAALMTGKGTYEEFANVADRLDNMTLRCRRHNVIRRPSHANGGLTFLTAEAGLMWLLFVHRPSNYATFHDLCRAYGLTMANIRFEEAWAMARWLQHEGLYDIEPTSKYAHVSITSPSNSAA